MPRPRVCRRISPINLSLRRRRQGRLRHRRACRQVREGGHDAIGRATKVGAGASGGVDPTEYFYDASTGALTQVRYTAGANTYDAYYYYDGLGRLTKISDWMGGGGLRYAFDGYGRMTRVTDYDGEHLDNAYNSLGQVTSVSDYHDNTTTYAYDGYGRMTAVTAPGSKTWTYNFDAYGRTTKVDIPNGMDTYYAFDGYGRMTSIEHKDGAAVLDGWTYGMDGGAITAITADDGSRWAYEHDANSRLTKAERYDTDGTSLLHRYSYTYDDADNMLTKAVYDAGADSTTSTVFAYGDANLLTSQSVGGTTVSFAYDDWGRMTSKSDGTYSATYAYRYEDKLYSVTSDFPSEGNATYQYDGAGKRRQRTGGGATTRYRWDRAWTVVNEEDNLGNLTRTYVGSSSAHVDGTNPSTGTWRFYVHDHLGSTRGVYNSDKTQYAAFEHDPYGELYASSGSVSDITRRYTGHDWDEAAEPYYAPHRYYAPGLARWTARDPLGTIDGPNVYGYVRCNPVGTIDPLGLSQFPPDLDPDDRWEGGCGVVCVCELKLCVCARIECDCDGNCTIDKYILSWPDRPKEDWWDALYDVLYVTCEAFDAMSGEEYIPPDVS